MKNASAEQDLRDVEVACKSRKHGRRCSGGFIIKLSLASFVFPKDTTEESEDYIFCDALHVSYREDRWNELFVDY